MLVCRLWSCTIKNVNCVTRYQTIIRTSMRTVLNIKQICSIKYAFCLAWWRHEMETFSALLALCAGNSPVTGEFPTQRPETQSFDIFLDLRLNKPLSKQSWGWWFETPSRSLWRHSNVFSLGPLTKNGQWHHHLPTYQRTNRMVKRMFSITDTILLSEKCASILMHWGRDQIAATSQTTFSKAFSWVKISLKISLNFVPVDWINNILALVQIMAWGRPGYKPLSEPW